MDGAWRIGEDALRKKIDSALSDSTNKQYSRTWQKYLEFCKAAEVGKSHSIKTRNCRVQLLTSCND